VFQLRSPLLQGCQIILVAKYQNGRKHRYLQYNQTKIPKGQMNICKKRQIGHNIYQHLLLQGPPKFTQTGNFCMKIFHLATLHGFVTLPCTRTCHLLLHKFRKHSVSLFLLSEAQPKITLVNPSPPHSGQKCLFWRIN
jgi:hypothetical protein